MVIRQDEVDYYYDLQRPAYVDLPLLRLTGADYDSDNSPNGFQVQTLYPPLVDAWSSGTIRVGEERIDKLFADAGAYRVTRLSGTSADGHALFYVDYDLFVSWRVLEEGLASIPDTRLDPDHYQAPSAPDVVLSWDGDDAVFTFMLGWGDCIVGCAGTHDWSARIPPSGEVTFQDLGGDPIPQEVQAAAGQQPAPL